MSRAGSRKKKFQSRGVGYGRLGPNQIAFLRTVATSNLAIAAHDPIHPDEDVPEDERLDSEDGTTFFLYIPVPGRKSPITWNFSAMTEAELNATRQFFNYLFDLAEPVVRARDKVAQDAFAEGDDSFSRVYRAVPQLIIRKGAERTNGQGLLDGLEGPLERDGDGFDPRRGLREGGHVLADDQSDEGRSQDYGQEAYES